MKKLCRSYSDRIIAGVCGGFGKYFDMDPTIFRLIAVALLIVSFGMGVLLYFVCWCLMPYDNVQ